MPEVLCRFDDVGVQSEGVVEHRGQGLARHGVVVAVAVAVGRGHRDLFLIFRSFVQCCYFVRLLWFLIQGVSYNKVQVNCLSKNPNKM